MNLQPSSQEIYEQKYQLKDKDGNLIDKNIEDTFKRVARGLGELEKPGIQVDWEDKFLWALENGAIPAGRIIANVGAGDHKANVSTINCLVSENILDSIKDIGKSVDEAMTSLSKGSGMGFCFSLLRPKGAHVNGIGASTSGPLSFAQIHDAACKTIASAGGRRGAMMLTFHVHHPDVVDVIKAKREAGNLSQFNISLLITDEFMESVKNDNDWYLYFPCTKEEVKSENQDFIVWKKWPVQDDNYVERKGLTACKIYKTIKARELWDLIMRSSYDYGEPGFILIDKVNRENNLSFCEDILATNPCGRFSLPHVKNISLIAGNLFETISSQAL